MKTTPNAFRVIKKDFVEAYKNGDLSSVPGLEGYHFNQDTIVNNCDYDPTKSYLHFFSNYNDANDFLEDQHYDNRQEYVICEFIFDDEFLKNNQYIGRYFSMINLKDVIRDEYIFPTDYYSKDNFIGKASPSDYKKKVNYDPDNYSDYIFGEFFGM